MPRVDSLGIDLKRRFDPRMGPIRAVPLDLEQIILNVLNNSLDSLKAKSKTKSRNQRLFAVTTQVTKVQGKSWAEVSIYDTGEGIRKVDLKNVWKPFYTTKRPGEGTGLGLTICQELAHKYGGNLLIDSKEGAWTRVSMRLPLSGYFMTSRILLVDDDDVTRKLLKEVLEKDGYQVILASSGEEAVQWIKRDLFPIILSDIRMIEMDGMAVLREVKRSQHQSAVILMTGFGSMAGAIGAIQEGAFDYLSKPFKMDHLKAIVARAFKHWESLRDVKDVSVPVSLNMTPKSLVGKSPKIVEVYKTLARAAMSASTVLVVGESGTGKELVARAIHDNGPRRNRRFIPINCGALSDNLLESELFGHLTTTC